MEETKNEWLMVEYPRGVASSTQLGLRVMRNICRPDAGFYLADMVLFKNQFIIVPTVPFSFHLYALLIHATFWVSAEGSAGPLGPGSTSASGL